MKAREPRGFLLGFCDKRYVSERSLCKSAVENRIVRTMRGYLPGKAVQRGTNVLIFLLPSQGRRGCRDTKQAETACRNAAWSTEPRSPKREIKTKIDRSQAVSFSLSNPCHILLAIIWVKRISIESRATTLPATPPINYPSKTLQ